MRTVFISYDHDDQNAKRDMESIKANANNSVSFHDNSLDEPVRNVYGDVNRRTPEDPASKEVRDAIERKLKESSKLLVLIGRDTHSSKWVKWEVETFKSLKRSPDILFMRVKGDYGSGLPSFANRHEIKDWNMSELTNWLR